MTVPLRWLPVILVVLAQVVEEVGQLPAAEPDIDAEFAELVRLSSRDPRVDEKHFGPIAPGTRRVHAPPAWSPAVGVLGPRQVQCGGCGLVTYALRAQRVHRTLDGRCLDPHVDYSATGLLILVPCYVTCDGQTVWKWPVAPGRRPADLAERERVLRLQAIEDVTRPPYDWDDA